MPLSTDINAAAERVKLTIGYTTPWAHDCFSGFQDVTRHRAYERDCELLARAFVEPPKDSVQVAQTVEIGNALLDVVRDVHSQHADDLCWMDIDRIFAAAGLPVPDRSVGDKCAMLKNCERFIETMCSGGKWQSYAELEAERDALLNELDPPICRLQFPDGTVPANAREAAEGWCKWARDYRSQYLESIKPRVKETWLHGDRIVDGNP